MPVTKIGTCPCPQTVRVRFVDGARQDMMCSVVANVYQVTSGSSYKSVCSGTDGEENEVGPWHEHWFGPYYLSNVTYL
jgi:hypothetical protein